MRFVCDVIAAARGWQRAIDVSAVFAGWEATTCYIWVEEFDEFVAKLGLCPPQTCSEGVQSAISASTLKACQHASEEAPGRPPPRERSLGPGAITPRIEDRVPNELL